MNSIVRRLQVLRWALLAVGLAVSVATCRDAFAPGTVSSGRIAVAPILPSAEALADFGLTIDAVRFVVVRPEADTLADTTIALPPDATELTLDLRVPLISNPETLSVSVLALSGPVPLFAGTKLVPVPTPLPPPEIAVDTYVGPVADSIVIQPRSPFILLNDSLRFQIQGFNGGVPVTQFYVAWSSSDSILAPINRFGVLRAPAARAAARVRARTPSGASDSVTVVFAPPATQLVVIAGAGQSDTVGQQLPLPLEVEARAADGLGVGGVAVRFRSLTGTGAVTDSLVVTDAAGRARTTVRLGGAIGAQSFEASVAGLTGSPVTFGATALAGPPAQLVISAGDAQLATVATAVATRPSVQLRDAGGNPVAGVSVTFTVASGGGGVTGGSQTTDATGTATVGSWTLGTAAGTNTLTAAAAGGVLGRTFTANGVAGAATQLVRTAGNLQSALVSTAVAVAPAVRAQDQYGNPVAGASITFAVIGGGGGVVGSAQLTNAAGVATVGGWTLGTAVGGNTLQATLAGVTPISFTATGLAGAPAAIVKVAGDLQSAIVNTPLTTAASVRLTDQFGNPVAGASVEFAVTSGGGGVAGAIQTTDAAGEATVGGWTLGTGIGPNALTATAGSLATTFNATALAGLPTQIATIAGDAQTAIVNTILPIAPAVIVRDQFNNPVAGVGVTFAAAGGTVTGASPITDATGLATVGSWQLATLAGGNTLTATSGSLSVGFTATGLAGAATQILKTAGDGLTAIVGTPLGTAPAVQLLDQFGNPVAGVTVTFAVAGGGGGVSGAAPVTNAAGVAALGSWTLGTLAGPNGVNATAGALSAPFTATGLPDVPALLQKVTGDGQTAVVNMPLATPPVVRLVDQYGNPIAGAPVLFDIQVDGGTVADSLPVTDALGLASPGAWTIADFVTTNLLQASSAGVPAVQFSAFAIPDAPTQMLLASVDTQTALVNEAVSVPPAVAVRDAFFNPVPGVSVTFALLSGGGIVTPSTVITNAQGVAQVTSWTVGPALGLNELEASAAGLGPIPFSANGITTTATNLVMSAGNGQSGVVASALATPYAVQALNAGGAPVQGVLVHWAVDSLGGIMSPTSSLTDVTGIATSTRFLGQKAAPQTATATVGGLIGSPVVFNATAQPDVPLQLLKRSADPQTGIVASLITAPVVEAVDQYDNPVPDVTVNFSLAGLGLLGATLDTTDAAGRATTGSWLLGNLLGSSTVTATAAGLADVVFTATGIAGLAVSVVEEDGNGQSGTAGQALPLPYRVRVVDLFGNPVRNITVNWEIDARAGGGIAPATVPTDVNGIAAAIHTLGNTVGAHSAFAWVSGLADTVTFTSTAAAGAAAAILKDAGDLQNAVVNTAVGLAPTVKVTDQFGAPVAGHSVTWAVTSGGGSLGGPATVQTDAAGIATAPAWTLGTAAGSNALSATSAGLTGSPVSFTATSQAGAPTQMAIKAGNGQSATVGTAVSIKPAVTVKDQFNNPVAGAQVTFTPLLGGGSVTGSPATTNAAGDATLSAWTLGTSAGANTLRASATGVPAVSFSAIALAGAPVQLAFITQPTPTLAGDTIDPPVRVAIQDLFGNTVPVADVVSLGFGTAPNPAAKLIGAVDVAAVNGVATFPELAIDSAGIGYTLRTTTPKIGGFAESDRFDIGGVIAGFKDDRLDPVAAAFDRSSGLVFVPGLTNALGVLDPGKGELNVYSILQSQPFGVAVNSVTGLVYITTLVGVTIVDSRAPSSVLGMIELPRPAKGIAVDEATDRIFVAVDGDPTKTVLPTLVVIDGKDRNVIATIPFREGALDGIGVAFSPFDQMVYVAIPNLGVGVFDPAKQEHVTTIPIIGEKGSAGTYGVAVDVPNRFVYATNRADLSFSVLDPAGLKELDRLRVGDLPEGLGLDTNKGVVYVANSGSNTISVLALDPKTSRFAVIATLIVGPTPKAAAVDEGSGRVYVPTLADDGVRIIQP